MTDRAPGRWQLIERLYHDALEQDVAQREAFLDVACQGDDALKRELQSLLGYASSADRFLERPALVEAISDLARDSAPLLAGRRLAGYEIIEQIGAGGMGEIYAARDLQLGREVAIKVIEPSIAADPISRARFEDEARSASQLNHPNIVTIYGVGDDAGVAFIAMERVHGETLRNRMSGVAMAIPDVLEIAVQLTAALAVAHARGIVHRDLKPENVMITAGGLVKVLDFGIARRFAPVAASEAPSRPAQTRTGFTESRHSRRHRGVYVAGTGGGAPHRTCLGSVLTGGDPLRNAVRASRVRQRLEGRDA